MDACTIHAKKEEAGLIEAEGQFEKNLQDVEALTQQEAILLNIKGGFDDKLSIRENKNRIQSAKLEAKTFNAKLGAYNSYSSFMMNGLDKSNKKEFDSTTQIKNSLLKIRKELERIKASL